MYIVYHMQYSVAQEGVGAMGTTKLGSAKFIYTQSFGMGSVKIFITSGKIIRGSIFWEKRVVDGRKNSGLKEGRQNFMGLVDKNLEGVVNLRSTPGGRHPI